MRPRSVLVYPAPMGFDLSDITALTDDIGACKDDPGSDACKDALLKAGGLEEQAAYVDKARQCVDDLKSPGCQDLMKEGAKEALVANGVDPAVADATVECIASHDSEVCAKASAKLAATIACDVVTEGAAAPLCGSLAPVIVDLVWPIAGPPLVAVWDVALSFNDAVLGALSQFGAALLGAVGLDLSTDAKPTVTEVYWDFLAAGKAAIEPAWQSAVESVLQANAQSLAELKLPEVPIADQGVVEVNGRAVGAGDYADAVNQLETVLKRTPGWYEETLILGRDVTEPGKPGIHYVFGIVPAGTSQGFGELLLKSGTVTRDDKPTIDDGWLVPPVEISPGNTDYSNAKARGTPWSFAYYGSWGNNRGALADAYSILLSHRLEALKSAAAQAVGNVVARNVQTRAKRDAMMKAIRMQPARPKIAPVWPWALGVAALGVFGGVKAWKKRQVTAR